MSGWQYAVAYEAESTGKALPDDSINRAGELADKAKLDRVLAKFPLAEATPREQGLVRLMKADWTESETGRAVKAVDEGARRTQDGVDTVEQARVAFQEIGRAVEDVGTRVSDIARSVQHISEEAQRAERDISEVASVAESSSASAEQVSASTQQTSASTQEIASRAAELATTASQLDELVRRFNVSV